MIADCIAALFGMGDSRKRDCATDFVAHSNDRYASNLRALQEIEMGSILPPTSRVFLSDPAVNSLKPSGHAGTGGLQNHSIGDTYPFTPIMIGGKWAILHCFLGKVYFPAAAEYQTCHGIHALADKCIQNKEDGVMDLIFKEFGQDLRTASAPQPLTKAEQTPWQRIVRSLKSSTAVITNSGEAA